MQTERWRKERKEGQTHLESCEVSSNKYRGGTSDATTSSSLIVPLFTMSADDFLPSKTAIFGVQK